MNIAKPENSNYAAIVVEIKSLISLDNCDNVQATIILGNHIIIDKNVHVGDIGLYFPLESQLSNEYCTNNNLYRNKDLNIIKERAGYFEENRRIRCVKFRGHKSEGLFMPIESLLFLNIGNTEELIKSLPLGTEFDKLNDISICKKYVIVNQNSHGLGGGTKKSKQPKKSRLVENQFRFHQDTYAL